MLFEDNKHRALHDNVVEVIHLLIAETEKQSWRTTKLLLDSILVTDLEDIPHSVIIISNHENLHVPQVRYFVVLQ